MNEFSRLLLLDDDPTLGELVRRKIKEAIKTTFPDWGIELTCASTWEEGNRLASTCEFDVVLLDLVLPPLHANDTISMLHKVIDTWPPVVIFTGLKDDEIRQKCMAFGAASFFLKCICVMGTGGGEALLQTCYNAYLRRRRQGI